MPLASCRMWQFDGAAAARTPFSRRVSPSLTLFPLINAALGFALFALFGLTIMSALPCWVAQERTAQQVPPHSRTHDVAEISNVAQRSTSRVLQQSVPQAACSSTESELNHPINHALAPNPHVFVAGCWPLAAAASALHLAVGRRSLSLSLPPASALHQLGTVPQR